VTSWLSCDIADADPVRFWVGFIEAPRGVEPDFGAEAAELLAMNGAVSADVTASIANDAARLPGWPDVPRRLSLIAVPWSRPVFACSTAGAMSDRSGASSCRSLRRQQGRCVRPMSLPVT
jgi:hypothetical protein